MANAHFGGPDNHSDAQDIRLPCLADSSIANLAERSIDEWDAVDTVQRLLGLDDEARAHMTPEEYSQSDARFAAVLAQHEERALARHRALHNRNESNVDQESTNTRTRPLDSQFGSDGNQYNPYAPHTSEEYVLQEIEAGRMDPEMMDMPRHQSNPAHSPLSGNHPDPPLTHVRAGGYVSWSAPGHRPGFREAPNGPRVPVDLSSPRAASWFQRSDTGGTADEDLGEEAYPDVYDALLPYLDIVGSAVDSHSPYGTAPDPVFPSRGLPFGIQGSLSSSQDQPKLNENSASGVPQQSYPASTGRERKRLAKPSLVVKLKTDSAQKASQAPVPLRRGISDASSSSESSSAARTTQDSFPFNLRSRGSVGVTSTNGRTRAGWEPQTARRLTRRAEAIQSSQRKRRRDAVSPQELSTEGTTTLIAGLPQGK